MKPLFPLGRVVATPDALDAFARNLQNPIDFLKRHQSGDWGDLEEEDRQENEFSVKHALRILSKYHLRDGTPFYCITEADRSATTILLVEEY